MIEDHARTVLTHPDQPSVTVRFEFVTPERAQELLEANTRNRIVRNRHVEMLAGDMGRGEFLFNGDAVRGATDGALMDGQHRLLAIVRSGRGQWMLVVENLPLAAALTIDIGSKRTMADIFTADGLAHPNVRYLAAMCRTVWLYEQYGAFTQAAGLRPSPSPTQLEDLLKRNPDLITIAEPSSGSLIRAGWLGAINYLCRLADDEIAGWFFARLNDGAGISPGTPVYALRERLLKVTVRGAAMKLAREKQAILVVRCWNATVEGQTLAKVPIPDRIRIAGCPVVPLVDREP